MNPTCNYLLRDDPFLSHPAITLPMAALPSSVSSDNHCDALGHDCDENGNDDESMTVMMMMTMTMMTLTMIMIDESMTMRFR